MTNFVFRSVAEHPYLTGVGVGAVILWIMFHRSTTAAPASGNPSGITVVHTGPSDAMVAANSQMAIARITANAQIAMANIAARINGSNNAQALSLDRLNQGAAALTAAQAQAIGAGGELEQMESPGLFRALGQLFGVNIPGAPLPDKPPIGTPVDPPVTPDEAKMGFVVPSAGYFMSGSHVATGVDMIWTTITDAMTKVGEHWTTADNQIGDFKQYIPGSDIMGTQYVYQAPGGTSQAIADKGT